MHSACPHCCSIENRKCKIENPSPPTTHYLLPTCHSPPATCHHVTCQPYNRKPPVPHQKVASCGPESCQFSTRKLPVVHQKVGSFPQFCHIPKDLHENWWGKSSPDKFVGAAQPCHFAPQCAQADVPSAFSLHPSSLVLHPWALDFVPRSCS